MKILAADFGTSSVKVSLIDEHLTILKSTKISYDYEVVNQMHIQIEPDIMFAAFIKCCKRFGDMMKDVDIIVCDEFSPCLIAMDKEGNALYPAILHLDRRSYPQSRYCMKAIGKEPFMRVNGNLPFAGGISCTSLLWIKDNEPGIYDKTYKLGHLKTFVLKKLVDKWIIDPTNAGFTGIYETFSLGGWSKEICGGLGIDRGKLPDVLPSISLAGKLDAKIAREIGVPAGIPVGVGANDSTSAAFGAGAVNNGDINNISGSSEIATITTTQPVAHEKYYLRPSVEEGKWIYLAITVGGFAVDWFRKQFYPDMDKDYFYSTYLQDVMSKNIIPSVRFLPHLSGDRHSLTKRKGAFSNLTLASTREEMLVAVLVGSYEPILNMIRVVEKNQELSRDVTWTGGLISDSYQEFKSMVFKGFTFHGRKDCSVMGCAKIALRLMS